jgi:hypothetical protein
MMAGNVKYNIKGIEAYHSNVYIQNNATINQNNYGIYMDGANYGVEDADELMNLVTGDQGCAWIINNTTAGVKAWDIALDIDAIRHQIDLGLEDPLINRFDGNGIAFDVCVEENNTDIADDIELAYDEGVMAKGNYWKSSGAPVEGTDYEINYKGGIGHDCDVALSHVEIDDYITSAPSGCSCELPIPCATETADFEDIMARIAESSCDETIAEQGNQENQVMIGKQFLDGYTLFVEEDYNYACQQFNYLRTKVESKYPKGLTYMSCRRIYFASLY